MIQETFGKDIFGAIYKYFFKVKDRVQERVERFKKEHFENINALFDLLDNNFLYVFIFFSKRMPD